MGRKKLLEFRLKCSCGASAPVFEVGDRFMAHCPGCGAITFWGSPALLERLKYSGQVCSHEPQRKPCKGGWTTWCPRCRVRCFYYSDSAEASEPGKDGSMVNDAPSPELER